MLLIPDCSDRTARKIDKHVLSVPLTLMMGRRYFFMQSWLNWYSIGLENRHSERISGFESLALRYAYVVKRLRQRTATPRPLVRIQPYALSNVFLLI